MDDPVDPRLARLRRLRAGRADPRLERLREIRAEPGRKAAAAEVFAGASELEQAPTEPTVMKPPSPAEVIGLNEPIGKAKQLAANVPELATMAARDVAGTVAGFAKQPHEGLGGEVPDQSRKAKREHPANPMAGLEAGQKVREKFTPALEAIDKAAGGAPKDMLGNIARIVGPLPLMAAGRAGARAVSANLAARQTGRDVPRVVEALRYAAETEAPVDLGVRSLTAQRARMAEATAVDASLAPQKPPVTPPPSTTAGAEIVPPAPQAAPAAEPTGRVGLSPRDVDYRHRHSPFGRLPAKVRNQLSKDRMDDRAATDFNAAERWLDHSARDHDLPIEEAAEKLRSQGYTVRPEAVEWAKGQQAKELGAFEANRVDPTIPARKSLKGTSKAKVVAGPPAAAKIGNPKFANLSDDELFKRRADVIDRMDVAQQEAGKNIKQWARFDDDVQAGRSGTTFNNKAGRAIGRKEQDGRIVEDLDAELRTRGHSDEAIADRYFGTESSKAEAPSPIEDNTDLPPWLGGPDVPPPAAIPVPPPKMPKPPPPQLGPVNSTPKNLGTDEAAERAALEAPEPDDGLPTWLTDEMGAVGPQPSKETIRAAAVRFKSGEVVEGETHNQAMERAALRNISREGNLPEYGFVTDKGRFVDRTEGKDIHLDRPPRYWPGEGDQLLSEDLLPRPVSPTQFYRGRIDLGRPPAGGFSGAEILAPTAGAIGGAAYGVASAEPEDSKLSRAATFGAAGLAGGVGLVTGAKALARSTAKPLPPQLQGAYDRARSRIDFGGKKQAALDAATEGGFLARAQRYAEHVGNDLVPIERLGRQAEKAGLRPTQNPRYQLSYVKSGDRTIDQFMREGVVDPVTRKKVGPSYAEITAPMEGDVERIRQGFTYAVQERAVGRGLAAFGGDQQALDDAVELVKHWRGDKEMQAFKGRLEAFTDGLGNYAVKSGLWTPKQWAAMKGSDALYIPFKRVMEDQLKKGARGPMGPGTGLANVTSGVKSFEGSKRAVADPARALAEYASAIIRRADRYRVGHHIFDAADQLGADGDLILSRISPSGAPNTAAMRSGAIKRAVQNAQAQGVNINQQTVEALDDLFTPVFDPKNPVIWRNGPKGREYGVVNAPDLWRAVSSLHQLNDTAVRRFLDVTIRPLRRIFVATTTGLTPRFAGGTNPVRDIIDAMAKSQAGLRLDDIADGYASAIGGRTGLSRLAKMVPKGTAMPGLYEDAERFGLGSVSNFSQPTSAKTYQQMLAPTSRADKVKSAARTTATAPLRPFETFGEVSDLGPRLGEAKAAKRQKQHLVDQGIWTKDDLDLYASTLGREVTLDFANKPGNPVLRLFADYVPFFGPSLNAPVSMAGALRRNPKRVIGVASGVASAGVIRWAMKHRSPEVLAKENDRTPGERGSFLFFPMDDQGELTIRVPIGQEMGIVAAGVEAGLDAFLDNDPHAGELFRQALLRALPPTEIPVASALIENARNKRNFGGTPVEPRRLEGLPAAERRLPTTSPVFDVLADAARKTGTLTGSESLKNTSPLHAENVVRSVFSASTPAIEAGLGPLASKVSGREAERKLPTPIRQNPLNPLGSLIANPNPRTTASEQDYYTLKERITQSREAARQTGKSGTDEAYERVIRTYGGDLEPGSARVVKQADEILGRIRQEEVSTQAAYRNKEIDGTEAKRVLDDLQRERQELYREAVRVLQP